LAYLSGTNGTNAASAKGVQKNHGYKQVEHIAGIAGI
jgi:hypothetical protein